MKVYFQVTDDDGNIFTEHEHYSFDTIHKLLVNAEIAYKRTYPEKITKEQLDAFESAISGERILR